MTEDQTQEPKRPRDNPPSVNKRKEFPPDSDLAPLGGYGPNSDYGSGTPVSSGETITEQSIRREYKSPPAPPAASQPALQVHEHRLTRLETDVRHIKRHVESIVDSLPGKSADEHHEHHDQYAEQLKIRREKEAEEKKLKRDLKEKFIKTIVQGVFMALVAILLLGLKSQFSEWVDKAITERAAKGVPATEHSAKEPGK